jgi:hypothetical protein
MQALTLAAPHSAELSARLAQTSRSLHAAQPARSEQTPVRELETAPQAAQQAGP